MSADGMVYTFDIQRGIPFWDGTELKAEDVVYTFQRQFKMGIGKVWGSLLSEVVTGIEFGEPISDSVLEEHIYETDEYTMVFNLTTPYAPFLSSLAYVGRGIIQKQAAVDAGSWFIGDTRDWTMVRDPAMEDVEGILAGVGFQCTGAYRPIEWSKGERILVERFDNYWMGPAKIKYILQLYVPERSTRYLMFMKGELDSTGIQAAELETFLNLPAEDEITVRTNKYTGMLDIIYFGQNFDEALAPPGTGVPGDFFDDVHMRKAFAYAFPYERYIQEVWLGWPDAAKGGLLPGWPGYYESFPYEYDLDKALEELKLAHGGKYYEEGFKVPFCYQAWATGMHDIM
jgi:peptide/nickel transport system substrate-binding protein